MPQPPDLSYFGVNLLHFVAGAIGGLIRGLSRPDQGWPRRAVASLIGAFTAGYGTPVVAPVAIAQLAGYGVTVDAAAGLIGFLLGLAGLSICEGVIRLARRWRDNPRLPGADIIADPPDRDTPDRDT
ncbi:MAG: hypothetical protein F9K43_18635 [Bauldia sp.]|nr:MAG: hypothetical protein F9K43_18635 [Bauldia sp.]